MTTANLTDKFVKQYAIYIWYLFLAIFSIQILNFEKLEWFWPFIGLSLLLILCKPRITLSLNFVLLILFSLFYIVIMQFNHRLDFENLIKLSVAPILGFVFGTFYTQGENHKIEASILLIVFSQFIYGFASVLLNFYLRINATYDYKFSMFYFVDFWYRERTISTYLAMTFMPIMSLLFYAIVVLKQRKFTLSFFLFFAITFSLISMNYWSRRTPVYITIIVFLINILIAAKFLINKKHEHRKLKKLIIMFSTVIMIVSSCTILMIQNERFSKMISSRVFTMNFINDVRFSTYWSAIQQLNQFPLGGYKMDLGRLKLVHNMWLDVYNATGIIPFSLLLLILFSIVYMLFKLNSQPRMYSLSNLLLTSIMSGLLLNFMVEPILEEFHHQYILFCIILGMLDAHYKKIKKTISKVSTD